MKKGQYCLNILLCSLVNKTEGVFLVKKTKIIPPISCTYARFFVILRHILYIRI